MSEDNEPKSAPHSVPPQRPARWLNRTVLGIALASLLSDWSHEIATAIIPTLLASIGAAAAWLGLIEGVSDGLSSFAKLGSGYFTDQMRRRKPIAVAGYVVTAIGTAAIGLATQAWQVLAFRATAWLGRGVRTPVRKALLAAAVTPETYGRAFGFDRMMDTVGAIIGPATATILLLTWQTHYSTVFFLTLIPGLAAAGTIALLVQEKTRTRVRYISFGERLSSLPPAFRRLAVGVGLFGAGDFAHSMLILLAVQQLTPHYGAINAASIATGLYVLHNLFYAGCSFFAGWLADVWNKRAVLAGGYALAAIMGLALVFVPLSLPALIGIFVLGGIYIAVEEALEDSLTAELVAREHHGMGFGVLATVNGIGDLLSSLIVGLLWTAFGPEIAFTYSTVLFAAGATVIWFWK